MKFKIQNSKFKIKEKDLKIDNLIQIILENRGIKNKKEIEEFLNPKLSNVTINNLAMDAKQLNKAVLRIKDAIKKGEKIVVFGDYDVDGICGTAILWETLRLAGLAQGKPYDNVFPYIPHRIDEGYGLSIRGIENIKNQKSNLKDVKLIITVDNGIVANKAVEFANEQGIDIIITDHHVPSKKLPDALAIVHTTKLCGTGVAYLLAQELIRGPAASFPPATAPSISSAAPRLAKVRGVGSPSSGVTPHGSSHLELVALATVADLVPLKGANRTLLKFGLEELRKTKRVGLLELFEEAGLKKESIGVYEIGHMIAPRLNAMGRLEYAMDSLRLICTNNKKRAEDLARLLGTTNKERQDLTLQAVVNSKFKIQNSKLQFENQKLLFISDASYEQGVIGLVAGKLVEEFYKPSIVVSIGEKFSKASARSVSGFNIIEFIRTASELLVDAGGHPMAAGFTVETVNLIKLQNHLEAKAELMLTEEILTRSIKIDCELPISFIDVNLYETLQKLAPFGMGNPEPTFISKGVTVDDVRLVGREGKHLKLNVKCQMSNVKLQGIGFGLGEMASKIKIGDKIDVVYTIDQNEWNGNKSLQIKIRDMRQI